MTRLGRDRGRLRPHQHAVADVAGQRGPPPRRAPPGHALPRRRGRQRRAQHPGGAPRRPRARDRPLAGDARAARAARPRRGAEHRDAGDGRPRARARGRQLRHGRLAVRRDALPGHAAGASRELARVVRPGGRVLVTAYGDPHGIEFLGVFVGAVQAAVPSLRGPADGPAAAAVPAPRPRAAAAGARGRRARRVEVETIAERTEFRSGEHLWDWLVHSNPIVGEILAELDLTEEQLAVVRDAAVGIGPAVLTAPVNIGIGAR